VFFRQLRIGEDGRPFQLLKFRTMQVNSDSDTTWSVVGDARVTRVGRLLRRTYLDELPQLLNVLRGEMSLVGPRPERPHFASRFAREVPRYHERHRVHGGITGWAQVHGLRGDTPIADRARFDNHYIEHWSLWRDVVIVVRTLANVLLGR
jgi:lipopolysaccharide/colanic/teichoic acid biosynthesis glycosyltransferase